MQTYLIFSTCGLSVLFPPYGQIFFVVLSHPRLKNSLQHPIASLMPKFQIGQKRPLNWPLVGFAWAAKSVRKPSLCNSSPGIDMSAEVSCGLDLPEGAGKVDTTEANGMALRPRAVRR